MHTILRLPEVKRSTGLSRSTIYFRITQGTFPRPVSLGGRAVGWLEAEIQDWLQRRIDASRQVDELNGRASEQNKSTQNNGSKQGFCHN